MSGLEGFVAALVMIAVLIGGLAVVDHWSQPPEARVVIRRQLRVLLLVFLLAFAVGVLILWALT